jgi:two-component system KDP operon response regulator KdpE
MSAAALLIVEDEPQIRRVLRTALRAFGYEVAQAECGMAALRLLESGAPDLLLLDLGLPDMDGTAVIQRIRETSSVAILTFAARNDTESERRALEAGADDILGKPFTMDELLQRIATLLAARAAPAAAVVFDGFAIDPAKPSLTRHGAAVPARPEDVALLAALAAGHGVVVSDEQLLHSAWGGGSRLDLRRAVHRLRALIEADPVRPRHLLTEAGIGYRLVA